LRHAASPTLFPYTTLFRSVSVEDGQHAAVRGGGQAGGDVHRLQRLVVSSRREKVDAHRELSRAEGRKMVARLVFVFGKLRRQHGDRKSTRLNSSHVKISYA